MNFPMFSCSLFPPNRKQSTMSKRAQERRIEEELAVAEAEVSMSLFGVKKPIERDTHLFSRFGYFTQPRIKSWAGILFQEARWNLCETRSRTRQRTLKSGKEMTIRFGVRGNPCGVVCVSVQGARGNPCEVLRTNLQGQGWTTTICKSQTINTLKKSPRMFDRSWIVLRMITWWITQSMYWSGDLCQQRWKHQFILGQTTMRIWLRRRTPLSVSSRRCSTLRRGWSWNIHSRFWMVPRLNGNSHLGWDPLYYMTSKSTRLLGFSFESGKDVRASWSKCKMGKSTRSFFHDPMLAEN